MLIQNLTFIILCLALGVLLRVWRVFPTNGAQVLGSFIIWVSYPALVVAELPALILKTRSVGELVLPFSVAWLQFGLAFLAVYAVGRWRRWGPATKGGLALTAGLGNTSFVGFPLVEAVYGKDALPIAVVVDQGSFLVVSTLGILTACYFAGLGLSARTVVRRVLGFPPFTALMLAIGLAAFQIESGPHIPILKLLSATLVPLALISVGLQLQLKPSRLWSRSFALSFGLTLKLLLIPALLAILFAQFVAPTEMTYRVSVLQAGMAPMITAAILATEFDLDKELSTLMVGLGIPLSLPSVLLWSKLMATL